MAFGEAKEMIHNRRVQLLALVLLAALVLVFMKDGNPATIDLNFGLEFVGGVRIPVTLEKSVDSATMGLMVDTIKSRINKFGLSQALVRPLGDKEIIVELPKASKESIANVESLLREQGRFEAIIAGKQALNGSFIIPNAIGGASGEQINPDGTWRLVFAITGEGEEYFAKVAKGKTGEAVHMFLDRPENASILLKKTDVKDTSPVTLDALRKALSKEGDDIGLYFVEDIGNDTSALAGNHVVVIGDNSLNSSAYSSLIAGGFSTDVNASRRIVVRPAADMAPEVFSSSKSLLGETSIFSWKAIGLQSAPTLQVEPLPQRTITQYTISGSTRVGSTPKELQANAAIEVRALKSVLSGGRLPVSTVVGSYYNISPSLGSQFLLYSIYGIIGAVILVAFIITLRYRRLKLVLPIIATLIIEILLLMAIIGGLGTLDLGAMAGVIALIGSGVDNQIIITDELLKKKEGSEDYLPSLPFSGGVRR